MRITKLILLLLILIPVQISRNNTIIDYNTVSEVKIKLLARLLESECSICPVSEKKLVGATVLNRIGHSDFPDNMQDVINQPNQYALKKIKPSSESLRVATQLLINTYRNKKVLYFYKPGHGFKRKNILIKTKYHHYAT